MTLADFRKSAKVSMAVKRFARTEKDHKLSEDKLNRLVELVIPTLTDSLEVMDLIDMLPKNYKANRRLYELAIRLDEKQENDDA